MDDQNERPDEDRHRDLTASAVTTDRPVWQLTPDADAPAAARRRAIESLPDFERIDDLLLAVSEAVTNAVVHGSGPDDAIDLSIRAEGSAAYVEIVQHGRSFVFDRAVEPTQGGRGLKIIELLVDEWGVHQDGQAATMWFRIS